MLSLSAAVARGPGRRRDQSLGGGHARRPEAGPRGAAESRAAAGRASRGDGGGLPAIPARARSTGARAPRDDVRVPGPRDVPAGRARVRLRRCHPQMVRARRRAPQKSARRRRSRFPRGSSRRGDGQGCRRHGGRERSRGGHQPGGVQPHPTRDGPGSHPRLPQGGRDGGPREAHPGCPQVRRRAHAARGSFVSQVHRGEAHVKRKARAIATAASLALSSRATPRGNSSPRRGGSRVSVSV